MAKRILIAVALTFCLGSAAHADHHWGGGWHGGWGWHGGGNDFGSGIVGGIIGGAIGNLFAPPVVVAPPVYVQPVVPELVPGSPGWYAYCQQKYRSWDGTSYLGFDGQRHPCV